MHQKTLYSEENHFIRKNFNVQKCMLISFLKHEKEETLMAKQILPESDLKFIIFNKLRSKSLLF